MTDQLCSVCSRSLATSEVLFAASGAVICSPCQMRKEVAAHEIESKRNLERQGVIPETQPQSHQALVLSGIGCMVGAVLWFIVGLGVGYIYFYPPALFILGLVTLLRGLDKKKKGNLAGYRPAT